MGGIEHRIHQVGRRLAKRHEVIVLTSRLPNTLPEEEIEGYRVIRLKSWFIDVYNPPFVSTKGVLEKLTELKPDLVDFHYRWAPSYTRAVMRYAGKVVHTAHNTYGEGEGAMRYLSVLNDRRFRKHAGKFSKIVCVSQFILDNYAQNGYPADKMMMIPNGVEMPSMSPKEDDFILSLGRIVRTKGLDYLLQAMNEIDTPLLICGAGPDRRHLERVAHKNGLEEKVRFLGRVSEERKAELLASCKFFVMPSTFEAFGIAATEAMSYGKPVIASDVGGLSEVVADCGILVPPRDARALGQAIRTLLEDEGMRRELSRRAKERAIFYSWDRTIEMTEKMYEEVVNSN